MKSIPEQLAAAEKPLVMGILNVTPDSFFPGSRSSGIEQLLGRAARMEAEGAALLDVGGESTRPGAAPVAEEEELERVVPAVAALKAHSALPVSVDTRRAGVAAAALAAGAVLVNDITALADPDTAAAAAQHGAGVVLMHMQGEPRTMQQNPGYADLFGELDRFFAERIAVAEAAGIPRSRIWLDPGIGFGKRVEDNLALIAGLGRFQHHGCPLLAGVSRKSFIGAVTGRPVEERLPATTLYHLAALQQGAAVLRVHDVAAAVEAVQVFSSLREHGWTR